MANPHAREIHRDPTARLRQLGAVNTKHSNSQRHVFWSKRYSTWITATRGPRGFILEFFRDCPCG